MEIDRDLIEAARAGGADLDRLLTLVWPDAYRVAFGILRDRGLAEDAAQDACASMARSLSRLQSSDVFRTWMYRIVVNRAITLGRGRHRTDTLDATDACAAASDPTDHLDLYRALAALPLRQRAAVLLHYYAGLNSSEIAAACGFPPGSVRFQLMLARRALRKALAVQSVPESYAKEASHGH